MAERERERERESVGAEYFTRFTTRLVAWSDLVGSSVMSLAGQFTEHPRVSCFLNTSAWMKGVVFDGMTLG